MVDASALDAKMPITQTLAPEGLRHTDAFDVGQGYFERLQRQPAFFLDEAMRGDADLGGPSANHHAREDHDADDEPAEKDQRCPRLEAVPPVKSRAGDQRFTGPERLFNVGHALLRRSSAPGATCRNPAQPSS